MNVGPVVEIEAAILSNWDQFHDTFADIFGFFDGYGRNMDAWIDCMGCMRVEDPEMRLSDYHVPRDVTLTIKLKNMENYREEAPKFLQELFECSALVNGRELDHGDAPLVAIAY